MKKRVIYRKIHALLKIRAINSQSSMQDPSWAATKHGPAALAAAEQLEREDEFWDNTPEKVVILSNIEGKISCQL